MTETDKASVAVRRAGLATMEQRVTLAPDLSMVGVAIVTNEEDADMKEESDQNSNR